MKTYIGVKLLKALPMTRGAYNARRGWTVPLDENPDDDGYLVKYQPDGYESWSPKGVFEAAYLEIQADDKISQADVDVFMGAVTAGQMDNKTTHVRAELLNGFVQHEVSSCVKPENYDHEVGVECATKRIKDRVWMLLGFVLQWGVYGLKKRD